MQTFSVRLRCIAAEGPTYASAVMTHFTLELLKALTAAFG